MNNIQFNNISFDMPKNQPNSIKVIGVGGGGSNAVNYMYTQQIAGVDFVICNTDAQALENSPIPTKIQLGADLTSGLGAGANPNIGEKAAEESVEEIRNVLTPQTKMVFITAGMGGGTGTGAAPIIAKLAKEMDILTVGIVTMPFQFEGNMRVRQAQKGIDELRANVDSLIVINNNKLRQVYGNLGFKDAFSKADEVLAIAAKGIAEVITQHYKQNIDLNDAKTVLSNSGTAIMGSSQASGTDRAINAICKALDSPLLNDNKITGAKNVLLLIVSGEGDEQITLDEIGEINDFIQTEAGYEANIIQGLDTDESLGNTIAVTVVATGFAPEQQSNITNTEVKKVYHTLNAEQTASYTFDDEVKVVKKNVLVEKAVASKKVVHQLLDDEIVEAVKEMPILDLVETTADIANMYVTFEEVTLDNVNEDDFIINDISEVSKVEVDLFSQFTIETSNNIQDIPVHLEQSTQANNVYDLFEIPVVDVQEVKNETTSKYFHLDDTVARGSIAEIPVVLDEVSMVEKKVIRHTLLDEAEEEAFVSKKEQIAMSEIEVSDYQEIKLEVRKKEQELEEIQYSKEVSPLNMTLDELKKTTEKRKNIFRNYNNAFNDFRDNNVDEMEKQPAFKRLGIDLTEKRSSENLSRSSFEFKDNNEIKLRRNNSFLHDNVD